MSLSKRFYTDIYEILSVLSDIETDNSSFSDDLVEDSHQERDSFDASEDAADLQERKMLSDDSDSTVIYNPSSYFDDMHES